MVLPQTAWSSVVYNWSYDTHQALRDKNEVLDIRPGAAHAPIGVKLHPQVYSVQQQSCQTSSSSVDIWGNGGRKTCFGVVMKHRHASA